MKTKDTVGCELTKGEEKMEIFACPLEFNQKLLEVQKPSKKQYAISGFLKFVGQTVFWLIEGAHAILEMLFSKRFLAAGGKSGDGFLNML